MKNKKTWKSRTSIFWGLVLVGAAVLLILNGIGVNLGYGISVWRIILGVLCLAWLVDTVVELRFTELAFPLAFLFLVFEPTIAHAVGMEGDNIISDWTVLLAALLLTIGLKALAPDRPGKRSLSKAGHSTVYLDGADISDAEVIDNTGSVDVYITNCEAYAGGGRIKINDNLGAVRVHIPESWNVTVDTSDNLGRVNVPRREDRAYDLSIALDVRDNVGSVSVIFE